MLLMVVEYFKDQDMLPAYKRLRDGGRMSPEGLIKGARPIFGL